MIKRWRAIWQTCAGVTMLCGRFEGVDERVIEHFGITEVILGDFVMTGGELAAQAMLDATVRLLPGVLGNADSIEEESHASGLLEHPQYTRPAEWEGREIPPCAHVRQPRRDRQMATSAGRGTYPHAPP